MYLKKCGSWVPPWKDVHAPWFDAGLNTIFLHFAKNKSMRTQLTKHLTVAILAQGGLRLPWASAFWLKQLLETLSVVGLVDHLLQPGAMTTDDPQANGTGQCHRWKPHRVKAGAVAAHVPQAPPITQQGARVKAWVSATAAHVPRTLRMVRHKSWAARAGVAVVHVPRAPPWKNL